MRSESVRPTGSGLVMNPRAHVRLNQGDTLRKSIPSMFRDNYISFPLCTDWGDTETHFPPLVSFLPCVQLWNAAHFPTHQTGLSLSLALCSDHRQPTGVTLDSHSLEWIEGFARPMESGQTKNLSVDVSRIAVSRSLVVVEVMPRLMSQCLIVSYCTA